MPTKFPKKIGEAIDKLYDMRAERLAAQKKVDGMKAEETALEEYILNTFDKSSLEGAKGEVATASISRQTVAHVTDWDALYKYIYKNKAFDLLQRRVTDGAFRERLEQHEVVPGVEPFGVVKLSLTKASRS